MKFLIYDGRLLIKLETKVKYTLLFSEREKERAEHSTKEYFLLFQGTQCPPLTSSGTTHTHVHIHASKTFIYIKSEFYLKRECLYQNHLSRAEED